MIPNIFGWLTADAAVSALIGTAVYPNVIPEGKNPPAIVYQVMPEGGPSNYLAERPGADRIVFQVTAWSVAPTLARDIAKAARDVMELRGQVITAPMTDFDPDTNAHAVRFEVSVWDLR